MFRRNLGLQLLALYLIFVVPVLAGAWILGSNAGAHLEHDVQATDLALVRAIALETDVFIDNALGTVAQLARTPEVQGPDTDHLAHAFAPITLARSEVNLVYVLDAQGIMRYHYPEGPGSTVGTDFSARQYFQDARTAHAPLLSIGRISPTTGQPVVTAVMPLRDASENFRGIVATNLALNQLSLPLLEIAADREHGQRVSILDASGQIIADSDPTKLLTDARAEFPAEANAVLHGETDSQLSRDSANREWLRSYVPIPTGGWGVVAQRPAEIALALPRAFRLGLVIAGGVFLVGGLLFWVMLARRVIAPLAALAAFSTAIGKRAVVSADRARLAQYATRGDQVGGLTRAVTQMERDIERRIAEQATLLETSAAVAASLDTDQVLNTILDQVQRLLGVQACAILTLDERANQLHTPAARGISDAFFQGSRSLNDDDRIMLPAIRAGKVFQIGDVETAVDLPASTRERARAEGHRAILVASLLTPHAPPAALVVYWREPHISAPEEIALISAFAHQAAMALENAALFARTDEKLREREERYRQLVEMAPDAIVVHRAGQIVFVNPAAVRLMGAQSADDLLGKSALGFVHPDFRALALQRIQHALATGTPVPLAEEKFLRLDGTALDVETIAQPITYDGQSAMQVIVRDITARKRAEAERQALLEIMHGLTVTKSLPEFLQLIHRAIGRVIYAENCFVAFYHKNTGLFEQVYWVDKYDLPAPPSKLEKGLTAYVFRTAEPLLLTSAAFDELRARGQVELVGIKPACWLSAPLKTPSEVIGVIAVQHYEDSNCYSAHDKEFLASIGAQVALAIERKRTEDALRESEQRFRRLFVASPDALVLIDPADRTADWPIVDCNEVACQMNGYTREELIGKSIDLLNISEGTPQERAAYLERLRCEGVSHLETFHRHRDGHIFPVDISTSIVVSEGRELILGIDRDITERKQAEEAVRYAEQRYRNLFEEAPTMYVITYNEEGVPIVADCNGLFLSTLGYARAEVVQRPLADFYSPAARAHLVEGGGYQRALAGQFVTEERELFTRDGRVIQTLLRAVPETDAQGRVCGTRAMYVDITERKRAEDALRASQQLIEEILNTIPVQVFWKDKNLVYLGCNAAFARDAGFADPQDIIGKDDYQMGWRDQAELYRGDDRAVIESGRAKFLIEEPQTTPAGNTITLLTSKTPLRSSTGEIIGVLGTYMDITERKRTEDALRASEARFRSLSESSPVGIFQTDALDKCLYTNARWQELAGLTLAASLGTGWVSAVHPQDRASVSAEWEECARENRAFEREFRFQKPNGEIRWVSARAAAIQSADGTVIGYVGTNADITERRRADEALQRQAAELERSNQELAQFAYVASHDLQEPLRMISSFMGLLAQRYQGQLDADADEFIGFAIDGAQRMQRLINGLLDYSRVGTRSQPPEPTDASAVADDALWNLELAIQDAGATVTRDPLPTVMADHDQLMQLFQNLIANGIKFRGTEPPRVHISARQTFEVSETSKVSSKIWEFSVRDNGIGIAAENLDRIFGIFQRLHSRTEYPGTGIGLATCKKIVERYGGRIWVESQPGQGSTFFFTIPAAT